jgi:hypothetical protein
MRTRKLALLACLAFATACTDTYDYDPATAGDPESDRPPRSKSPSQFVRAVYSDLLGRSPETYDFVLQINGQEQFRFPLDEEAQLVGTLDGIGDSQPLRNLITNGILHGDEVSLPDKASVDARTFITEQFRKLLGREPNTYELAVFANEWAADPAVGPRTVIRAIIGSREYQSQ